MTLDESTILVTGGSGNLGRACQKILPRALYPGRGELDITSRPSIEAYFESHLIESIVHMAAVTDVNLCEQNKNLAYMVNVTGTRLLLESARSHDTVRYFLYMSSVGVFSGGDDASMEDEDSIPYPRQFYGITKLLAEEITRSFDTPTMQTTVIRTNFTSMPWAYPRAFTDRFGTYLFAQGVSKGIRDILITRPPQPIIHICGDRRLSMYEYATLGGSQVEPMTMDDYHGTPLTRNMSITSKYWKLYKIEESDPGE